MRFTLEAKDGSARAGRIETCRGVIETPVFMPVGTAGAVKTMTPDDLTAMGFPIQLGNTYHLLLRPGLELLERAGGLHRFIGWNGSILTDSGGFQVWSLADLTRLTDDSVSFRSHLDGREETLTPERAVAFQRAIGSDIAMVLDDCPALPSPPKRVEAAVARSLAWARRSREEFVRLTGRQPGESDAAAPALFAIVQGGTDLTLRRSCADALVGLSFDGHAIGGLSVGETKEEMYATAAAIAPALPAEKPRYLMGVGTPEDLWECVGHGVDMFDCVLPTRTARNGLLFTSLGRLNLKNARFRDDLTAPDPSCDCYTCQRFSRAYLRHLFLLGEYLYGRLATLHNLRFYSVTMRRMREAIVSGQFRAERAAFLSTYRSLGMNDPALRTAAPA